MTNATDTQRPTSIAVSARKWFDKKNGNTYFSVTVRRNDTGETLREPFEYGYGDQWEQRAADMIEGAGWMTGRTHHPHGGATPLRLWAESQGVRVDRDVVDVPRKRDL